VKKHIERAEREILVPVSHKNDFFKALCTWLSRQVLIPRIAAVATSFNPLTCQAWHGYGVSNAHHGEVRKCRRACERTMLELGTDSYTEVVPAPQGGRLG
jgi:hypothetical protein